MRSELEEQLHHCLRMAAMTIPPGREKDVLASYAELQHLLGVIRDWKPADQMPAEIFRACEEDLHG
jgi:hypothetical protein